MLVKKEFYENAYDLQREFRRYGRDYYRKETYKYIIEYFCSLGEEIELDVIGICCDIGELTYEEVFDYFRLELDQHDLEELSEMGDEDYEEQEFELMKEKVIDYLEYNTSVLGYDDKYIVFWNF